MPDFFGPPRLQFCEGLSNYFIAHPADTWTNIAPLIAGIYIILKTHNTLDKLLGYSAIIMAIGSTIYHGTNTFLGETLDVGGMFIFILTIAFIQHNKLTPNKAIQTKTAIIAIITITIAVCIGFLFFDWMGTPPFAIVMAMIIIRQLIHEKINEDCIILIITFGIAWGAWWVDYLHIMCNPNNHILTGHGIWHLLNGLIAIDAYRIYIVDKIYSRP